MTVSNSILVLGAGELGSVVLRALAAHSQRRSNTITVVLRPTSTSSIDAPKQARTSEFKSLGISTLAGDIVHATEAELSTLFTPFDTIIGCTGMTCPAGTQLKLARAVLASHTRRYIPWQFGVDYDVIGRGSSQDLFSEQLDVRELLRKQSGTEWVIVSTGLFMSFLRVVAEVVLAAPEAHGVVFTAGETSSYGRVAEVVEKVLALEVEREEWTVERLRQDSAQDPENGMKKYRVVFAEGKGVAWDTEHTFNVQRGMGLQGVEDWARLNLS
ncbi:hypothetical protein MMC16_003909 [Acarospora aff. strigata]|nr:hypothetical protein [Acarospora aff. strigata]